MSAPPRAHGSQLQGVQGVQPWGSPTPSQCAAPLPTLIIAVAAAPLTAGVCMLVQPPGGGGGQDCGGGAGCDEAGGAAEAHMLACSSRRWHMPWRMGAREGAGQDGNGPRSQECADVAPSLPPPSFLLLPRPAGAGEGGVRGAGHGAVPGSG